jgi:hypothetical protein
MECLNDDIKELATNSKKKITDLYRNKLIHEAQLL